MYLKKLTLRGFKSFASATSFDLEPGITCIVGPNGSGKSNVVDALAWVMGEQGAKSLRGASMEDVIFAGTASRAPLGRAEIQLTIDNTDGALPIEYSEVAITRTKFRNGNSEYAINGSPCRLIDVRELLSDSGIGRQMHVIVGQGHLDQILQATPEARRGFVEEAAGVLKHRERKEKALRKLDATAANLHRLTDLIAEIRRQLKPLGRQAEVAQRASQVQADLRDAKARLLADDLAQASAAMKADGDDEAALRQRRVEVEAALKDAREAEDESREAMTRSAAGHARSQELWFSLSGIAERVHSIITVASERVRSVESAPGESVDSGPDPDTLDAQADAIAASEDKMRDQIDGRASGLEAASAQRVRIEADLAQARDAFETAVKERSGRREAMARLAGQLTSLTARLDAGEERLVGLVSALEEAQSTLEGAVGHYEAAQQSIPDLDAGEEDLDTAYTLAEAGAKAAADEVDALQEQMVQVTQARVGLTARVEALRMAGQAQADGANWLTTTAQQGILGPLASLIRIAPGYFQAVTAGLGAIADAVVGQDFDSSVAAVSALTTQQQGRADVVVAGEAGPSPVQGGEGSPRLLMSVISAEPQILAGLSHAIGEVLLAENIAEAMEVLTAWPEATVVTTAGERFSRWQVAGGSDTGQSALQIASALQEAQDELADLAGQEADLGMVMASAQERQSLAQSGLAQAVDALHQSDAAFAAAQEEVSHLSQVVVRARAEVGRLAGEVDKTRSDNEKDRATLAQLREKLEDAKASPEVAEPDPSRRDQLTLDAAQARAAETEARLALRTAEERARALVGQSESLREAAQAARVARAQAEQRRALLARRAEVSARIAAAAQWLLARAEASQATAAQDRDQWATTRTLAEEKAEQARIRVRDLAAELDSLVDSAHREELARAQQRMRIDALAERAMAEVGLDVTTLMDHYGPDQLITVGEPDPTTGERPQIGYVREEQLKRLRTAERDLQLLGRVNPLAMEEYDAMQERHRFLASQLEDVKQTRADLLHIIDDVDTRVQEVFQAAFTDVSREFAQTFARLFPGGQGSLVLTEPGRWLTTGVDVEARPAGKKVKRLSLLSGGERALVAVCFLIALFKARPSPFYILDEVEAALDDTNLGRLLQIYEELRATSQLLVITHQKRTMEIADTLYGVTMGADGTSTVVSQRLRED